MDTADYEISFSTTSAAVSGLDATWANNIGGDSAPVSYTHLRAHETVLDLVCRLLLEKKKTQDTTLYFLLLSKIYYSH